MKISPRQQLILVVVGLTVVLVAVAALLVWPQFQKGRQLDTKIGVAEQELSSSQALLSQRQQIKNRVAVTDAQWLQLATLVPQNPDLPSLIIDLQDTAFASGVQLTSVVPGEPVADKSFVRIPLQITINGTWADTVDYLKRLPRLARGVRELSFASAVQSIPEFGDPVLPNYSELTNIVLEAYVIPVAGPAVPAAVPAPAPQ